LTLRKVSRTLSTVETDPLDAQSALDAAAAAELRSAQIATSTPWYAPWYGITCAGFPVSAALAAVDMSDPEVTVNMVMLASLAALMATYRRVTGVWPSIRSAGWLVPVKAIVVMGGAATLSYLVAGSYGIGWWLLPVAVVTAVLMALLSRGHDAALVRKHSAR
jgi:hypothetical protein